MSVARWVRRRPDAAWHAERPHRATATTDPFSRSWCGRPVRSSSAVLGPPVTQCRPQVSGLLCRACVAGIVAELAQRAAARAAREALEEPAPSAAPWQAVRAG